MSHKITINQATNWEDIKYLKLALEEATFSDCRNQHGCVIVRGGNILSKAHNKWRNHPHQVSPEHIKSHCTVHAEVAAIKGAGDCRGATMYVARQGKREVLLSRPCNACYNQIIKAGIKTVYHT
jgi:deoxycytidylate deaminase